VKDKAQRGYIEITVGEWQVFQGRGFELGRVPHGTGLLLGDAKHVRGGVDAACFAARPDDISGQTGQNTCPAADVQKSGSGAKACDLQGLAPEVLVDSDEAA